MEAPERFWQTPREWARDLAAATVIGAFLGVLGPFGSFNGGPLELRVIYWIGNVWLGFILLSLTVRGSIMLGARYDLPIWFVLPAGIVIGSIPLTLAVTLFSAWIWPHNLGRFSPTLETYVQCLIISAPFSVGYFMFFRRPGAHGPSARDVGGAAPTDALHNADFLDRLPPRLGRDLLCLQMEDHYVRAHTPRGSDLILMPLSQAIAGVEDREGMQVHRSWWVARDAVVGSTADGRNLKLKLSNGVEAPVSRTSVVRLKEAGWLAAHEPVNPAESKS